jgi:hypothetical protein
MPSRASHARKCSSPSPYVRSVYELRPRAASCSRNATASPPPLRLANRSTAALDTPAAISRLDGKCKAGRITRQDRSQVDPLDGREPAPLEPPNQPLTGDTHAHLLDPANTFAASLGYTVTFESTPDGVGGWCDRRAHRIVVNADAPANAQLRILIHETAHALGIDYHAYTREQAEVLVDTITYIVCAGLGLAIDGETIPYVAGWGEHGALDAVNQFANTIDQLARRIENAINAAPAASSS